MKNYVSKILQRTALLVAVLAAVFLATNSAHAQTRKAARTQSAKVVIANQSFGNRFRRIAASNSPMFSQITCRVDIWACSVGKVSSLAHFAALKR